MKLSRYFALTLVFCLSIFPTSSQAQKVAVMGAEGMFSARIAEVQMKLEATGLFEMVDAIDISSITPTLQDLQNYCGVMFWANGNAEDGKILGDNLADYIDAGGGVVGAVFATTGLYLNSGPMGENSRFNGPIADPNTPPDPSSGLNYWVIVPTDEQVEGPPGQTLGTIFVPDHPILAGVNSFDGNTKSYRPEDNLHSEATRIANWTDANMGNDNNPLIATRLINGTRRADLGFYPPSNDACPAGLCWLTNTDGALIMANALLWVCNLEADLAVTKADAPDPVEVENNLTYTLTVNNLGPIDATGVVLTDTLPIGVNFVSVSPALCTQTAGTVTCNLGDLASGAGTTVTIVVTPSNPGTITNNVTVMADQTDPDPENNSATATTTVIAPSNNVIFEGSCPFNQLAIGIPPGAVYWWLMPVTLLGLWRFLNRK